MVATPPWYPFYMEALGKILTEKPKANVLISAAADWGMVAQLRHAAAAVSAHPTITLYDICQTPLRPRVGTPTAMVFHLAPFAITLS